MSDNNEQVVPFFARYLEAQFCDDLSEAEMDGVQGGLKLAAPTTLKFPPEGPDGIATTLKFPSDQEDGGVTSKLQDQYVTKKYPSDGDDHIATTQKYPSDGDDYIVAID
jgi:hypothetical protein